MLEAVTITSIVLFYISLFVELYFYSIPSIVSTKKILKPDQSITDYFSEHIKSILNWSLPLKVLVFVVPMIFIYVLHLLPAYALYDLLFFDIQIQNSYSTYIIGIGLVVFGRIISHLYLLSIKKIKTQSFTGFVTSGLFKFSRNPGLLGLYISFLGFYVIQPSTLFLICYLIYIIHMHFKIIMEENYLTNTHGEDYKEYLQKTRRYL
ncbi:methyltransferase family protein [Psychroserpens sp.]|uniref:methyltransferase family protein n=1 Tax=Psychroserpens sp. TaxID=2020870 RepID=UPI00385BF4B5